MSSSIALSSVPMAGSGATRSALSQLVATRTSRNRSIWCSARNYHSIREKMERIAESIDKFQRHPQANLRRKTKACNSWPATAHRDPSSSKGWSTHWPQSSRFSELFGRDKTYWDAELEQMNHRIAHLKRQVARDPYEAIFGRRVHSSHYMDQSDTATAWPGFLRTFLGVEKPTTNHPSKVHLQDFNFTQSPAQSRASSRRDTLEYDPISGRMAPKAPKPQTGSESTMQSSNAGVDCPPGSELETKFASEFNLDSQHKEATSVDCSSESELESRIVAETTRAQLSDPTIDCSPGSELEALFTTNPATVQVSHYPPVMATGDAAVKKANVTVDCTPGNGLEAKLLSDAASAEIHGESEDLTALDASDIRARYTSLKSDGIQYQGLKDTEFDASNDRVGDFLQSQNAPVATQQWSQTEYRILAYDTTAAAVTTAESDSFFGANEPVQPHEILSRLHNPGKFVPYFAQMQQDGYEIATGGGDILVFKRSVKTIKHTPAAAQQDSISEDVQADIASYLNNDSYDSTSFVHHYHPSSTTKVSRK